jgi:hypothetical protein
VTNKPQTIQTSFEYVDVRIVGDRVAVCLGFKHGFDGTPIHSVGTVTYNPGVEYVFDTCGETLLRLMQVAGVTSLDRVDNRPVRAVLQDGIPIELISATDDRIRWRLP